MLIIAKRPGKQTTETQAYRYPKAKWTEAAARAHCKKYGGRFEPATKGGKSMDTTGDMDVTVITDDGIEVDGEIVGWDDLVVAYKAQSEREKKRAARDARAKKYGIAAKEGGNLTPPKGYPTSDADYGDPVNYRYPADAAHAKPALGYFNHEGQREAGGYSSQEWGIIGKRLAKLVSKHLEATYEYRAGKLQKKEGKSLAVKALREEDGGVVVGGYLLLWGAPEKKDLGGDYFTPETELWLDAYKSVPALFHHGLDQDVGLAVMGRRVAHKTDDTGAWVEDWLDKSNKFWTMVKPLLDAEALYYSPGSAPHLVKREEDGRLKSFPVVEDTLTPIPMQHRLLPVEQIQKAYKAIGLELPQLGGDESGDSCSETEKLKAEVEIMLSELEMEV